MMRFFYKILHESFYVSLSKTKDSRNISFLYDKYLHSLKMIDCAYKVFGHIDNNEIGALLLHDIGYFNVDNKVDDHAESGYNFLCTGYDLSEEILASVKLHESDDKIEWYLDDYCKRRNILNIKERISIIVRKVIDCDIITNFENTLYSISFRETNNNVNKNLINCLENNKLGKNEYVENSIDRLIYMVCGFFLLTNEETIKYIRDNLFIERIREIISRCYYNNKMKEYEQIIKCLDNLIYEKNSIKIKKA